MTALPPDERQRRSRASREREGAKAIHVVLSPEAADKLAAWQARGLTIAQAIEKLLLRSKP